MEGKPSHNQGLQPFNKLFQYPILPQNKALMQDYLKPKDHSEDYETHLHHARQISRSTQKMNGVIGILEERDQFKKPYNRYPLKPTLRLELRDKDGNELQQQN